MTKVEIKNGNITPFGGLFYIFDTFEKEIAGTIDGALGPRGGILAYDYSDIFRSLLATYLTGGECLEDIMQLIPFWKRKYQLPSSDTVARTLKGLAESDTPYVIGDSRYSFNEADRLNDLLIKCLCATGQLHRGDEIDVDFDHQFLATGKPDAKYCYKHFDAYSPGVMTTGGIVIGVEGRDGNTPVKFKQAGTLCRFFLRLIDAGVSVRNFRADCGSFSKEVIEAVAMNCQRFYIRSMSSGDSRAISVETESWEDVRIGDIDCSVSSYVRTDFIRGVPLRVVDQRSPKLDSDGRQAMTLFGPEYVYRTIITNDFENSEKDIILFYNGRGASERVFDELGNDFGWKHLPFSYLRENTVFMIVTAIIRNFFMLLKAKLFRIGFAGLDSSARVKRFVRNFVCVSAKFVKKSRGIVLNLYTDNLFYRRVC